MKTKIKKVNNGRKLVGIVMLLFILVLCLNFVGAISVSMPKVPVEIYPGQEKEITLSVSPSPDEGNITVEAELVEGFEIAEFANNKLEYNLEEGSYESVKLKLEVGEEASVGEEYKISVKFSVSSKGEGGTVTVGHSSTNSLNVQVVEKPVEPESEQPQGIGTIWWVLGAIVVIIIITLIWMIVKNNSNNSNGSESE